MGGFSFIDSIIIGIIHIMNKDHKPMAELEPYHEFLLQSGRYDIQKLYEQELGHLLKQVNEHKRSKEDEEKAALMVKRMAEIAALIQGTLKVRHLEDLRFELELMAQFGKKWELIKSITGALFPILSEYQRTNSLHLALIAAAKTNDEVSFNNLIKYIPEQIDDVLLTYNLACAFACFARKEGLIQYVKRSIQLGKTKQQFMDDTDFNKYLHDTDFLEALSANNQKT